MSIRAKITACLLVTLAAFAAVTSLTYLHAQRGFTRFKGVTSLQLPMARELESLAGSLGSVASDMRRRLFQNGANQSDTFSRMAREFYPYVFDRRLGEIEKKIEALDSRGMPATGLEALQGLRAGFDAMVRTQDVSAFEFAYRELYARIRTAAQSLDKAGMEVLTTASEQQNRFSLTWFLLSLALVLLGILAVLFSHRVLSPLPVLIESIRKIAAGDFQQGLKVSPKDSGEVAELAREYNRMLLALKDRDLHIQSQQREILKSERLAAVGQLSAEIVHEIRNPLNSISLNIEWLSDQLGDVPAETKKVFESISKEVERLFQITETYLVRARVPSQATPRVGLNSLLEEILEFTDEETRSRSIEVEPTLFQEELYIRADRARLKQAFINILKNAKEAMPRGGKLRVATELCENVCRVRVTDSGYGMNETVRRNVFEPFYTTKPGGTGLGLVLTKSIVEEANGTIHCESQVGFGTTFTLNFPI